jgi:hypothetical protein
MENKRISDSKSKNQIRDFDKFEKRQFITHLRRPNSKIIIQGNLIKLVIKERCNLNIKRKES